MSSSDLLQWTIKDVVGKRALVVFAHPDDVDFHFGGTVASLSRAGAETWYLCATRGDKGDRSGRLSGAEIAEIRATEQREAAQILGANNPEFLDLADGQVEYTRELVATIGKRIREIRPDIVITLDFEMFDPSWGVNHADHRAISTATIDAVYPFARNPNFLPGVPAHTVPTLLVLSYKNPNVFVDTSGVAFELQIQALRAHKSQWGNAERVIAKRLALGPRETYHLAEFS
jgi:LmbE family N-acetylglucosaminyl deacetylase